MKLSTLVNSFLDLIYPRYCLICYTSLNNTDRKALCAECAEQIEFIHQNNVCYKCGTDFGPYATSETPCQECFYHPPRFTKAIGIARYKGIMRELIHQFKYARQKVLLDELSNLLIERWLRVADSLPHIDFIIPAPLYRKKLKERGFNQSELLAEKLHKATGIPIEINNLIKIQPTPDQASLNSSDRKNNLIDAFEVTHPQSIKDKNILLIDDVLTTGATASEIARTLKKNGAKGVYVLVLAR
ncbi:MAG: ComF family protein [Planctomycetota bacterium]